MKSILLTLLSFTVIFSVFSQEGCTNNQASNYDPLATIDDGSCCLENSISFEMTDSFGDGGISFSLLEEGTGNLLFSATMEDGYSETLYACIPNGCHDLTVSSDFYQDECGLIISSLETGLIYEEQEGNGINETATLFFTECSGAGIEGSGTCSDPYLLDFFSNSHYTTLTTESFFVYTTSDQYLTISADQDVQVSSYGFSDPCTDTPVTILCGEFFTKSSSVLKIEPGFEGSITVSACSFVSCDPGYCGDENACNYNHFIGGISAVPEYCTYDCCIDETALNFLDNCYSVDECMYAIQPGDYNGDYTYSSFDLSSFLSEFGSLDDSLSGDINQDGSVSAVDLSLFLSLFGSSY